MLKTATRPHVNKVVLAYSGGLDTSVIVPWLKENYGCEVICYTADIGQGEELSGLPAKAVATGASKIIIEDLREEFSKNYLFSLLRSGAIYERKYMLGTSIARPLIASRLARGLRLACSRILANVDGDTWFPDVDWNQWRKIESELTHANEKNDYATTFEIHERI